MPFLTVRKWRVSRLRARPLRLAYPQIVINVYLLRPLSAALIGIVNDEFFKHFIQQCWCQFGKADMAFHGFISRRQLCKALIRKFTHNIVCVNMTFDLIFVKSLGTGT